MDKNETNKIIDVQAMLFNEMKRLDEISNTNDKEAIGEYKKATSLYNMSTNFIKTINTNIQIINMAKRTDTKYDELMKKLGL